MAKVNLQIFIEFGISLLIFRKNYLIWQMNIENLLEYKHGINQIFVSYNSKNNSCRLSTLNYYFRNFL